MSMQRAAAIETLGDDAMLDVETSSALLRWMETAVVPDGIRVEDWEDWMDNGCRGRLEAGGEAVTPAMLGRWARSGVLR
jgi:hypothetical protein